MSETFPAIKLEYPESGAQTLVNEWRDEELVAKNIREKRWQTRKH